MKVVNSEFRFPPSTLGLSVFPSLAPDVVIDPREGLTESVDLVSQRAVASSADEHRSLHRLKESLILQKRGKAHGPIRGKTCRPKQQMYRLYYPSNM